ncbi:hypothetical protein OG440_40670 (plasmid) [Streptomyces sp. NBC_00637]|uniref:hypothetical protein n=1 Tax=Streptomyces sp. NBC_00637 TaxID=2903667 RepID=UPI002F90D867
MTDAPSVISSSFELHNSEAASPQWRRLAGIDSRLEAVMSALPSRMRLAQDAPLPEGETVGFASTTVLDGPLPVPAGVSKGVEVTRLTHSFFARTFQGSNGQQLAACGTVLEAPGTDFKVTDAFVLEAHGNDLLNATELVATSANVLEERDGWWDALTGCLGRDCGGVCLSAALSCPKVNWAAFLLCLAGRCGVCVVKCAACATCDCTWWCKWAAGCCDQ